MSSYDKSTRNMGVRMCNCQGCIKYPHPRRHEKENTKHGKDKERKINITQKEKEFLFRPA
jgi:hypothetical protein